MQKRALPSPLTPKDLAERLNTTASGDLSLPVTGICSLEQPTPDSICFAKETRPQTISKRLKNKTVTCLLVHKQLEGIQIPEAKSLIFVSDPFRAMLDLIPLFYETEPTREATIDSRAHISPDAKLGSNVRIGAFCSVAAGVEIADDVTLLDRVTIYAGSHIGMGTLIHSGVVIREHCVIGKNCTIHNNSVIGADGFGYTPGRAGLEKVPQLGRVIIGDNVEIGATTCIDRGTFGDTVIGYGSKIDNQVQIGHNVTLGQHVVICGQAGIAGSSVIGDGCVIGGGAGIADHLTLVPGVRIGARAGVTGDLLKPGDYTGLPAIPAAEWRRQTVSLRKATRTSMHKKNETDNES